MERSIVRLALIAKERAARLKRSVTDFLHWDEQSYADCQYDNGLLYIETYLNGDVGRSDLLSRSKTFWAWWRNHWALRDQTFLDLMGNVVIQNIKTRRRLYVEYNNGRALADSIHPNSSVLNESYTAMINEISSGPRV